MSKLVKQVAKQVNDSKSMTSGEKMRYSKIDMSKITQNVLTDLDFAYENAVRIPKWQFWRGPTPWKDLPSRKIVANRPDTVLPDNSIQTNKYTLLTFVPKNLMEQFSKLANVYFLVDIFLDTIESIY
jgi:hypothetical protein